MIKCVVSDLDGTLINNGVFSAGNYYALNKLEKNGIRFVIATGRNCISEKELKDQYITILLNGALIKDEKGNILYEQYLNEKELKIVVDFAIKNECSLMLYTNKGQLAINKEKNIKAFLPMLSECEIADIGLYSMREFNLNVDFASKVYKCEIMDPINCKRQRQLFKELSKYDILAVTSSVCNNIEINSINTSKMNGLRQLMNIHGYSKDEIAVFGDGLNDLCMYKEMIETFAVKNAIDDIINLAKYHLDSCEEDGFAQGIDMILKMKEGVRV